MKKLHTVLLSFLLMSFIVQAEPVDPVTARTGEQILSGEQAEGLTAWQRHITLPDMYHTVSPQVQHNSGYWDHVAKKMRDENSGEAQRLDNTYQDNFGVPLQSGGGYEAKALDLSQVPAHIRKAFLRGINDIQARVKMHGDSNFNVVASEVAQEIELNSGFKKALLDSRVHDALKKWFKNQQGGSYKIGIKQAVNDLIVNRRIKGLGIALVTAVVLMVSYLEAKHHHIM